VTVSYETGTTIGTGFKASKKSAYDAPYFNGAAANVGIGGVVVGGGAAAVAMFAYYMEWRGQIG